MSMFKSKPEMRRNNGSSKQKKYLEDMKMRIEEAENRGKNVKLRNDGLQHQKES